MFFNKKLSDAIKNLSAETKITNYIDTMINQGYAQNSFDLELLELCKNHLKNVEQNILEENISDFFEDILYNHTLGRLFEDELNNEKTKFVDDCLKHPKTVTQTIEECCEYLINNFRKCNYDTSLDFDAICAFTKEAIIQALSENEKKKEKPEKEIRSKDELKLTMLEKGETKLSQNVVTAFLFGKFLKESEMLSTGEWMLVEKTGFHTFMKVTRNNIIKKIIREEQNHGADNEIQITLSNSKKSPMIETKNYILVKTNPDIEEKLNEVINENFNLPKQKFCNVQYQAILQNSLTTANELNLNEPLSKLMKKLKR